MPLRDYQLIAVDDCREAIRRAGSCVLTMPTGSGKTVVAGEIARLASEKGSRTMFLCHRRELVKQITDTLLEYVPGVQVGTIAAGMPEMPWAPLQVASVQTLARRTNVPAPTLMIWDECHHTRAKTWETIMQRWPDAKRIGLTATPQRLDQRGLGQHFSEMVFGPNIPELVAMGSLAPTRTLRVPMSLILDGLKKDRNGEYRAADLSDKVTGAVVADAVDAYMRYAKGKRAIFFGIHRSHSRQVCEGLRARGVRAEHVDGDDPPARRDRIMLEFKTGGIDVVGNCQLITEGFDAPACEVVMLGAPTRSVTMYLQQAGRAMRPGEGKTALVLDLAGISHELGLPDEVREWDLADGEIRQPKKAHAAPRECTECHTVFYGRVCPECAYAIPLAEIQQVETELEEAKGPDRAMKQGNRRNDLWRDLAIAKKSRNPEQAVYALAQRMGFKSGWATHIIRAWRMAA